jgi:membrane fusion protein (multidrug efflux system)
MANQQPKQPLAEKSLLFVVALAITMFALGGLASYWALRTYGVAGGEQRSGNGAKDPSGATAKSKGQGPRALLVRVSTIQRQAIVPVRTLVGDLIAVRKATIPTEVAGKVVDLPVDEGTMVVGGQTLLARIDDTWTNLEEAKITSQIQEKQATLSFENSELTRYENMLKDAAIPLSETEKERTVIKELQASIAQLNVLLKEVQERKSRLEIMAPFDGSVVSKYAELGEYVPVGSPIVDIVSSGRIDARIMVPEESLPLLEVGTVLDVVVDSLNLELKGEVFSINAQGSVGSRTFPVRIALDDRNGKLLPGMGVSVFVPVMRGSTELLVPRDAVLTKPDGSTIWIVVSKDHKRVAESGQQRDLVTLPVPIRVLSHTRDSYAIEPVRESDKALVVPDMQVVTEGLERLTMNAAVRIDPDKSPLKPVPGMYRTGQQVVERPE